MHSWKIQSSKSLSRACNALLVNNAPSSFSQRICHILEVHFRDISPLSLLLFLCVCVEWVREGLKDHSQDVSHRMSFTAIKTLLTKLSLRIVERHWFIIWVINLIFSSAHLLHWDDSLLGLWCIVILFDLICKLLYCRGPRCGCISTRPLLIYFYFTRIIFITYARGQITCSRQVDVKPRKYKYVL